MSGPSAIVERTEYVVQYLTTMADYSRRWVDCTGISYITPQEAWDDVVFREGRQSSFTSVQYGVGQRSIATVPVPRPVNIAPAPKFTRHWKVGNWGWTGVDGEITKARVVDVDENGRALLVFADHTFGTRTEDFLNATDDWNQVI